MIINTSLIKANSMLKRGRSDFVSLFPIILLYFAAAVTVAVTDHDDKGVWDVGPTVAAKDQRRSLVSTEYGEISAAKVTDGINGCYYLQFITLEPNALFLPVILHADMVFYVQTGSGRVSWIGEGEDKNGGKGDIRWTVIQRGDVFRLQPGSVFFIQSSLETERLKLRISAIFADSGQDLREPGTGPYSSIRDLVTGSDKKILQVAFQVPKEVVEEITSGRKPLVIVPGVPESGSRTLWEVESQFMHALFGRRENYDALDINKKKKRLSRSVYNILTGDRDVKNRNGWSSTVTGKQLRSLRGSSIGIFMVNLTEGAMMGPHWNPVDSEIAVVVEGRGVVQVVCPGIPSGRECKNTRVRVKEGDVFVVPRFHPVAQMSFNNGTFVFVGFTTTSKNNRPQFLAGRRSVLQTLDKQVLAESFNVSDSTIGRLLTPQREAVVLECASCAEEEERLVEEEIEKKKKEEEIRKREEEKRKQEEEARKREEEKKSKEKEEEKRREEARRKNEEEARQREEQAKQDERRRQAAAREEAAARQQQEEMEKQQQEGEGGGSHGKKEPEFWPGGPEEGRVLLNNVLMG